MSYAAKGRRTWLILSAAWGSFFSATLSRFVVPALLPLIQSSYALTSAQAGLLVTAYWVTYAALQVPAGLISDRFGAERTNYTACAITGLACVLAGFSGSYAQLFVLQLAMGFASAFVWAPGVVVLLRWFHSHERAYAVGLFQTGFSVAATVSFFAAALIVSRIGILGAPFWVFGGVMMIASGFSLVSFRRMIPTEPRVTPILTPTDWGFLKNRLLWYDSLARFGSGFAYLGSAAWVTSYLFRNAGLPLVQAALVGSAMSGAGILGYPAGGIVADKILKKRAPVVLLGTFMIGLLVIALGLSGSLLLPTIVGFIGLGFFYGLYGGPSVSVVSEFGFSNGKLASATSFANFMAQGAGVISPTLFGLILDTSRSYEPAWILLGVVTLLCSIGPALLTKKGY